MPHLLVAPQKSPLKGTISVPGDKSISHRAVMLAALANGQSQIRGWLPAGDTLASLQIIQSLGIKVRIEKQSKQSWDLAVDGLGMAGLKQPLGPLDCKNAGTCMRLMAGILAGQPFSSTLDGSAQLRQRPMKRIVDPLSQMGANIESDGGKAPLIFRPAALGGISYRLPVASAQVKSAILLAGLFASGDTSVHQPGPARDHTERMLTNMGAHIEEDGQWIHLRKAEGKEEIAASRETSGSKMAGNHTSLRPLNMEVPGDISSAAFPVVAAAVVRGSQITVKGVGCNQTRTGVIDTLNGMGANIEYSDRFDSGGEPTAAITVEEATLSSCKLEGDTVVRAIDEIPIWAVSATQAQGISELRNAAELRVKEVDRLHLLAQELRKMGAEISEKSDGLEIQGTVQLKGCDVNSHGDHRLAMALAVAGLIADSPTTVLFADCINDSFPGFVETMQSLGANIKWDG